MSTDCYECGRPRDAHDLRCPRRLRALDLRPSVRVEDMKTQLAEVTAQRDEALKQVDRKEWVLKRIDEELSRAGLPLLWTDGGGSAAPHGWHRNPYLNIAQLAEERAGAARLREALEAELAARRREATIINGKALYGEEVRRHAAAAVNGLMKALSSSAGREWLERHEAALKVVEAARQPLTESTVIGFMVELHAALADLDARKGGGR